MPIFEYKCPQCGHFFEKLVRSASEKPVCPNCSHKTVDKQFSSFSAAVSGSPTCEMKAKCPSAGTRCCSGGTCGLHK